MLHVGAPITLPVRREYAQEWRGIGRFLRGLLGWHGSLTRAGCIEAYAGGRGSTQMSQRPGHMFLYPAP